MKKETKLTQLIKKLVKEEISSSKDGYMSDQEIKNRIYWFLYDEDLGSSLIEAVDSFYWTIDELHSFFGDKKFRLISDLKIQYKYLKNCIVQLKRTTKTNFDYNIKLLATKFIFKPIPEKLKISILDSANQKSFESMGDFLNTIKTDESDDLIKSINEFKMIILDCNPNTKLYKNLDAVSDEFDLILSNLNEIGKNINQYKVS